MHLSNKNIHFCNNFFQSQGPNCGQVFSWALLDKRIQFINNAANIFSIGFTFLDRDLCADVTSVLPESSDSIQLLDALQECLSPPHLL